MTAPIFVGMSLHVLSLSRPLPLSKKSSQDNSNESTEPADASAKLSAPAEVQKSRSACTSQYYAELKYKR